MSKDDDYPQQGTPVDDVMQKVSDKFHIDINLLRAITAEELKYILDHMPFLQILSTQPTAAPQNNRPLQLIEADSGWTIHDYGDALSSSPGKFIFGGGYFRVSSEDDDEGGSGGIVNPGHGTIRNQAFVTAQQMVGIAHQQGWAAIQFVDGHPMMLEAAWIAAEDLGMNVIGYTPDDHAKKVQQLLERSDDQVAQIKQGIRPGH